MSPPIQKNPSKYVEDSESITAILSQVLDITEKKLAVKIEKLKVKKQLQFGRDKVKKIQKRAKNRALVDKKEEILSKQKEKKSEKAAIAALMQASKTATVETATPLKSLHYEGAHSVDVCLHKNMSAKRLVCIANIKRTLSIEIGKFGNIPKQNNSSSLKFLRQTKTRQQKIQDRQPRNTDFAGFKSALLQKDRVGAWLKFTDIALSSDVTGSDAMKSITKKDFIDLLNLLSHHQITSWKDILRCMKKNGIKLDHDIYEMYLSNLCKLSMLKEATDLLMEMKDNCIDPRLSTYNIILRMYAEKNLQDMLDFLSLMKEKELSLDFSTHSIVIKAFAELKDFKGSLEYYNSLLVDNSESPKPDAKTMSILIRVADGLNDLPLLKSFHEQAKENGLMDKYVYSTILSVYSKREMNREFQSLAHDLKRDYDGEIDLPLYTVLIKYCLEHDSALTAFEYLKEMKEKAIYPDTMLLQTVTDGLVKSNEQVLAYEFIKECQDQGYQISMVIYRSLLQGLATCGDDERAAKVYEKVSGAKTHAIPTSIYNIVLSCASKAINVELFRKVWGDLEEGSTGMSSKGFRKSDLSEIPRKIASPNIVSYEIALAFNMKMRDIGGAIMAISKLIVLGKKVSPILASDLIKMATQSMEYKKAAEIVSLLERNSISVQSVLSGPDGATYYSGFCHLIEEMWRSSADVPPDQLQKDCFLLLDVYNHLILPSYPSRKPKEAVFSSVMGAFTVLKDLVGVVRTWTLVEKEFQPPSESSLEMLLKAAVSLGSKKTAVALLKMVADVPNSQSQKYKISRTSYDHLLVLAAKFTDARPVVPLLLDLENSGNKLDGRVWRLVNDAFQERKLQCGNDKLALKETLEAITYVHGFIEEFFPEIIEPDPILT